MKLNGSGRVSLRTRSHLKPLLYIRPLTPIIPKDKTNEHRSTMLSSSETTISPSETSKLKESSPSSSTTTPPAEGILPLLPRRSSRQRKAPDRYGEWTR